MEANNVIAICSALIALAAISISVWQGYLNREHFRLSVKPNLNIDWKHIQGEPIEFTLKNNGLGPAIIKGFSIKVDDVTIDARDGQPYEKAIKLLCLSNEIEYFFDQPSIEDSIDQNRSIGLVKFIVADEMFDELEKALPRVKFNIIYTSMYGEEILTYNSNH